MGSLPLLLCHSISPLSFLDLEAASSLVTSVGCSFSNSLNEFRKKFLGTADRPPTGIWHLYLQDGQLNLFPWREAETWLSKQPLHRVCRHGKMRGSIKSPRQMGHSSRLSTVPSGLPAMSGGLPDNLEVFNLCNKKNNNNNNNNNSEIFIYRGLTHWVHDWHESSAMRPSTQCEALLIARNNTSLERVDSPDGLQKKQVPISVSAELQA